METSLPFPVLALKPDWCYTYLSLVTILPQQGSFSFSCYTVHNMIAEVQYGKYSGMNKSFIISFPRLTQLSPSKFLKLGLWE